MGVREGRGERETERERLGAVWFGFGFVGFFSVIKHRKLETVDW